MGEHPDHSPPAALPVAGEPFHWDGARRLRRGGLPQRRKGSTETLGPKRASFFLPAAAHARRRLRVVLLGHFRGIHGQEAARSTSSLTEPLTQRQGHASLKRTSPAGRSSRHDADASHQEVAPQRRSRQEETKCKMREGAVDPLRLCGHLQRRALERDRHCRGRRVPYQTSRWGRREATGGSSER